MKNKMMVIAGIVVLVAVLAAGAFTAVQMMAAQNGAANVPAGAMVFEDVMDDGSGSPVTVKTIVLPAENLPQRPAEVGGVLVRQADNSYFVGTGSVSVSVNVVNGETTTAVEHSGPEVEVVAGKETQFFKDVTEVEFTAAESKEQTLQQKVVPVDQPLAMPEGANLQVWGEKRGDRIVAEIIVYAEAN